LSQYYETFILIQWDGCPNTMRQTLSLFQNSEHKRSIFIAVVLCGTVLFLCLI